VCRGASATDNKEEYFDLVDGVLALDECKERCRTTGGCTGIEHWGLNGRCELWKVNIGASEFSLGFRCMRFSTEVPRSGTFAPVDSGLNRVCRGASATDNKEEYFDLVDGVLALDECKERCRTTGGCTGIEHWSLHGRCELWTVNIGASEFSPGFRCMRFSAEVSQGTVQQEGAAIPVGGDVRLYAVGSSNAPWNTWLDQLHMELDNLGFNTPIIDAKHPDTLFHPTSVPVCDDAAGFEELRTPRIGKIGWASWGFAFENQDDCNAEGFRRILSHNVSCTNGWACNPQWTGVGQQFIRPSDIAEDAQHSHVTVFSNWMNDSKQRHARNVCYNDEAIPPVGTTEITLFNLKKVIHAIHAKNPDVVVAVMALYPDSYKSTGIIVERTLPMVADINAAMEAGLRDEPNVVWVNYTYPTNEVMFQTFHTGHPNCRGDKVLAQSIIDSLYRNKVLARGFALSDDPTCLPSTTCEGLSVSCCQRAALCRVGEAGTCVDYSAGEQ